MVGGNVRASQSFATQGAVGDASIDDHLAIQARTDAQAFGALYERHVGRVFRYLRARGASEDVAADLTAVTFERALRHIDQYRPRRGGFPPWLMRIARNALIDLHRRGASLSVALDEAADLPGHELAPDDAAIAAEERGWIVGLVARLPDPQQEAIALRFAAGLSAREIAPVIGKSEAATKKLLSRALAALKEASTHVE